jgi:hypothetical protein
MARTSTAEIERARAQLTKQETKYARLAIDVEELAWLFQRSRPEDRRELAARFHDAASKLPYVDDYDFGALVLECVADSVFGFGKIKRELQIFLYEEAVFRARLCAQAASAGGEAIARSTHLTRLSEKLQSLAQTHFEA